MSKKDESTNVPATVGKEKLVVMEPDKLVPAALIGVSNEMKLSKETLQNLPEEFQGSQLETLDTTLPPTVKWTKPGEFVAGVYEGSEQEVGPNKSMLYHFDAKGKKFSIWGTTTLDRVFGGKQIQVGDLLLVTYIGDLPTDMQPCKMFDIKRAGVKKA